MGRSDRTHRGAPTRARSGLVAGPGSGRAPSGRPLVPSLQCRCGSPEWLTLAGIVVTALVGWRCLGRSARVSANEVSGPTTAEYGSSQNSVRAVVVNRDGAGVEIGDIHLMCGRNVGNLYTD